MQLNLLKRLLSYIYMLHRYHLYENSINFTLRLKSLISMEFNLIM